MKNFIKLYEDESADNLTIDQFKETIEKLKDVFGSSEPVQTAAIMLCDIISKIVDDSDSPQDIIDSFQDQLDDMLENAEVEGTEDESGEDGIEDSEGLDVDQKFEDMKNDDFDGSVEDDSYVLDNVEENSDEEKLTNLKKITSAKKEPKKEEPEPKE